VLKNLELCCPNTIGFRCFFSFLIAIEPHKTKSPSVTKATFVSSYCPSFVKFKNWGTPQYKPSFPTKKNAFMKKLLLIFSFLFVSNAFGQSNQANIITSDIDNFWIAFDKITATKDSAEQYNFIKTLYLDKGTDGLKAIMKARQYTAKSYINAINQHPLFWASVRANTLKAAVFATEIDANIGKMKKLYPALKPAKMYFTVGAFRTNGTTMDGMVLIGSELALADKNTITTEFSPNYSYLRGYFDENPSENVVFLNVHEYIHTQQKTTIGNDLLMQCVLEGVAEFMAVKTMEIPSPNACIAFGTKNDAALKAAFVKEMLGEDFDNWIWNTSDNPFKMRDLGYYMGYAICEKYYNQAKDKSRAIKEMIELEYNNSKALWKFVDKSNYFEKPVRFYQKSMPTVVGIKEFKNGDKNVDFNTKQITISFSTKMNKASRGFDLGPLGESNVLSVKKFVGFSDDGKSVTIEVEMKPNQHYQLLLSSRFMDENGAVIKPYLIDITTKAP
jgi:hypothetical protein